MASKQDEQKMEAFQKERARIKAEMEKATEADKRKAESDQTK